MRHTRRGFVVLLLILCATFPRQAVQAQGSVPAQPTIDVGSRPGQAIVYWKEANDPSITKWQYQYKIGTGNFGAWADVPNSYARTYSYLQTGLSNGYTIQFKIRAVNANGAGTASSARGSVPEADGITLSTASTRIAEGDSDLTSVAITVTLSKPAPQDGDGVSISIENMDTSTARWKAPCSGRSTLIDACGPDNVIIPAGSSSATYTLSIVGDTRNEDDETVYLRAKASGWSRGTIRLVIADNESGTATPTPVNPNSTHTYTPVPPTATHTHTPVPPTATHTHTPAPATDTPVPPTATHTPTGTRAPTDTPVPPTATHTDRDTGSVAATSLQATATPVPTRIRLYQRRSHEDDHPVPTHTPVVRCPAPRRSL